ncbi:MAG: hypothetical protein JWP86_1894, partial [Phenylobacterium sp.]|nr:hypothetical protein [Phenylobacterium sp.]
QLLSMVAYVEALLRGEALEAH